MFAVNIHLPVQKTKVLSLFSVALLLVVTYFFTFADSISAQVNLPGVNNAVIELFPPYPKPLRIFTARITDVSFNLSKQSAAWYINGELRREFDNEIEITLTAPSLGERMDIRVITGGINDMRVVVVPSEVDIIVEGDTLVPYFYKGRRVPGLSSRIYLSAVPHIFDGNGRKFDAGALVFTWSINDEIVETGAGKQNISVVIPEFADAFLSLTITGLGGSVNYRTSTNINFAKPIVHFYAFSPLSGISPRAISTIFETSESEVSFRAEPYFVSSDIFSNAETRWTLDGTLVEYINNDPLMLTLGGGIGVSEVGFTIQNLSPKKLLQSASGLFFVNFTETGQI